MDLQKEKKELTANNSISKTSRILAIYHLFLTCQEVSYKELADQLGIGKKMASRDINLLQNAGILKVQYNRKTQAFIPVTLDVFSIKPQKSKQKQKYVEKLQRCCILMKRMQDEFGPGDRLPYWPLWVRGDMSKIDFYREIFPDVSDRTRQRDFNELEKLGYEICYFPPEPDPIFEEDTEGVWCYKAPAAYELPMFPPLPPF